MIVVVGGCLTGPLRAGPPNARGSAAVVDSRMRLADALAGCRAPARIRRSLALVTVRHIGFDGRRHTGQIVVRRDLAREVAAIFGDLERARFPIERVVPVVRYRWSDAASMAANNTSGFNYRRKPGDTGLSRHAYGAAMDINPMLNPYVRGHTVLPRGARRRPRSPGTIVDGPVVRAFTRRGWRWGGHFRGHKDWQHFYKPGR